MLLSLMMLAMLAAAPAAAPNSAIEATVRGTDVPLDVELFRREPDDGWTLVGQKRLAAGARRVRFHELASGVYQLRLRGPKPGELLATAIAVGTNDTRRRTIAIEPFILTGAVTLGGTELGAGTLVLRHRELRWHAAIPLAADGTFRATLWQRGAFEYEVRGPALATTYTFHAKIDGAPLLIDIPDGRIRGIVRDAATGEAVAEAVVGLQTNTEDREEHVKLTTGPDGRFDFSGVKFGRHTVRVFPPRHLEPEPVVFTLDASRRLQELDVRVDAGRSVALVVIDGRDDPAANAVVLAVTESKVRARTTTDEDGRATIAVPPDAPATLFVIPEEGLFAVQRLPRTLEKGRLQVYLPRASSSLLLRATTTTGGAMPRFSLLMRYNGELVPPEVADALAVIQGVQLTTSSGGEVSLQNIPSGSYEFWPYRTEDELRSIIAASALMAPIQVDVRTGENKVAVKFAAR